MLKKIVFIKATYSSLLFFSLKTFQLLWHLLEVPQTRHNLGSDEIIEWDDYFPWFRSYFLKCHWYYYYQVIWNNSGQSSMSLENEFISREWTKIVHVQKLPNIFHLFCRNGLLVKIYSNISLTFFKKYEECYWGIVIFLLKNCIMLQNFT